MRELEFLPDWYPVMRRRRSLATTQAWATAALMIGACLWGIAGQHDVMNAQMQGRAITTDLVRVRGDLKMLDEQLRLKRQLQQQDAILRQVGLQVDGTRLLGELDELMGRLVFLLELSAEVEETIKPAAVAPPLPVESNGASTPKAPEPVDRKLKVKLVGVAPSDMEVANFLAGMTSRAHLDQVAMTYARDRVASGRVMRQFEVTFQINLSGAAAAASVAMTP